MSGQLGDTLVGTDERFSAAKLTRQIELLAGSAYLAQLDALVVERQQEVHVFLGASALRDVALRHQRHVKHVGSLILNRLMPVLVDASGATPVEAASLINVTINYYKNAAAPNLRVLGAVRDRMGTWRREAAAVAEASLQDADDLKAAHADFAKVVETEIASLEGADGLIAKLTAEIEATRKAMGTALDAIVSSGGAMASGLNNLFSGVIGVFTPSKDKDPKPDTSAKPNQTTTVGEKPSSGGAPDTKPTTAGKPKPAAAGAKPALVNTDVRRMAALHEPDVGERADTFDTTFVLEGIGGFSGALSASESATAQHDELAQKLVRLYHKLFEAKTTIAVVTAIGMQVATLEGRLRKTATLARAAEMAWRAVEDDVVAAIRDVEAASDDPAAVVAALLASLHPGIVASWRRLSAVGADNKAAFAGQR